MMEKTLVYDLTLRSPVHVGLEGVGQERLDRLFRSDALFGAIVSCWKLLFDDDEEDLVREAPFLLSSCFPILNGVRFYPLPLGCLDGTLSRVRSDHLKKWKKVCYVDQSIFQKMLNGNFAGADAKPQGQFLWDSNRLPVSSDGSDDREADRGPVERQVPRIGIDPVTGTVAEGAFFYCTNNHFRPGDGLFFLATFATEETIHRFEAALRLLGDTGIGGDRSVGRGLFAFAKREFDLTVPETADAFVTLSLYHPTQKELQTCPLERSFYSLTKRSGYVAGFGARPLRRRAVFMFEEGSVFFAGGRPDGDSPLVLEKGEGGSPFNVFRHGRAFAFPMKGGCFE